MDDDEGLDLLIKQKKKRPNYARVMSVEFSKPSLQQTKKKPSVKKRRDVESASCLPLVDDDCSGSDGSEYFSAEEFILSTSSSSISSDEESSLEQSSDSVFESLDSSFRSNFSLSDNCSETQTFEATGETKSSQVRHRAPSKKQKRKRRQTSRDMDLQFYGLDLFDIGFNDLKVDIAEPSIHKPVPSLVDLCISAARKIPKKTTSLNVPRTVRQILQIGSSASSFRQLQLDCLLNLLEVSTLDNPQKCYSKKQLFPVRNVWSLDGLQLYNQGDNSVEYLSFLSSRCDESAAQEYNISLNKIKIRRGRQLSVLAHLMDLLLPGQLTGIKSIRKRHKSDADSCSAEMDARFKNLKQMIQNRFDGASKESGLNDDTFNIILPYVCWARGDIKKATQGFLSLVETDTRVRYKALFLYEAGRMLSQFGDTEAAVRYFNLAADALQTKKKHKKPDILQQIDRQNRLLCAAVQDIGLMDQERAERSLQLWRSSISIPCHRVECAGPLVTMDTFLCYYGAYWHEKTGSLFEEAVNHLTTMATKDGYLYFYLSMMYAFMGKGDESSKMYRKFLAVATFHGSPPGSMNSSELASRRKPWQPLVEKIKEQGSAPTPMKVIWRTQLVPPKVVDPMFKAGHSLPQEADTCSRNLNLRRSGERYLTGDMQMVLPPVRGVYLDLYTGKLSFPKVPSQTESWQSYETNRQWTWYSNNLSLHNVTLFYLPTSVELYRGPNGETVEMVHTNIHNVTDRAENVKSFNPHLCHLMWTGALGQKAKINVYHRMQWFRAENLQRKIKTKNYTQLTNDEDPKALIAEQIKLIPKYINKGWAIHGPRLLNDAVYRLKKRKPKAKSENDKRKGSKRINPVVDPAFFVFFSVVDTCQFRLGLALAITFHEDKRHLMIINCSSKEKFRKPVIITLDNNSQFSHFAKQTPGMACQSDVFCVKTENGGYLTYNVDGELVNESVVTMATVDNNHMDPITFSSNIFYLTEDKRLCRLCFGCDTYVDFLGEITNMASVADILVMVTQTGAIKFIDITTDLAPLDPILDCNKPLDDSVWKPGQLELKSTVNFSVFKVVGEAMFTDDDGNQYTRAAIALDNNLLIVKIHRSEDLHNEDAVVTITMSLTLPGFPQEIHFINETAGFLLTVTQHMKTKNHYRENLYHYTHNGQLKQVLLCLGQGPRSFLTCYLPEDTEQEYSDPDTGREGRRVYMRDGHDGIICALLS